MFVSEATCSEVHSMRAEVDELCRLEYCYISFISPPAFQQNLLDG